MSRARRRKKGSDRDGQRRGRDRCEEEAAPVVSRPRSSDVRFPRNAPPRVTAGVDACTTMTYRRRVYERRASNHRVISAARYDRRASRFSRRAPAAATANPRITYTRTLAHTRIRISAHARTQCAKDECMHVHAYVRAYGVALPPAAATATITAAGGKQARNRGGRGRGEERSGTHDTHAPISHRVRSTGCTS